MYLSTGGLIAIEMGLCARYVCAVTVNDIVARTIVNGDFSVCADVIPSHASAMDIQVCQPLQEHVAE